MRYSPRCGEHHRKRRGRGCRPREEALHLGRGLLEAFGETAGSSVRIKSDGGRRATKQLHACPPRCANRRQARSARSRSADAVGIPLEQRAESALQRRRRRQRLHNGHRTPLSGGISIASCSSTKLLEANESHHDSGMARPGSPNTAEQTRAAGWKGSSGRRPSAPS